jgi:hypothetical protein
MLQRQKCLFWAIGGIALVLGACLAHPAAAQVLYGSVVGTVTDQSGALIPGATVTLTNTQTGQVREATTDSAGNYSILNVLEGTYDLTVAMTGFRNYVQKGITVSINTVTRTNVNLELGQVTDTVTVEATAAALQTSKSDVSVNLETKAMEDLPLGNYRNYQSLINLVPGAAPARLQNAITDTPGRSLTTNINGQNRGANNTRLDGAADILVTMPHHAVYVPPVESIETVNISTDNFDAEQGITGGAAVTVATKSGTNDFHGTLFALHDNSALRAFTWDENTYGVTDKPRGIRNIDGANLGGPIIKNKLFFFANWEGTFERDSRSSLFSVAPADFRTGDFNRVLGAQILDASGNPILVPTTEGGLVPLQQGMIFDPYTGTPEGTGRSVFSSGGRLNVIPASRLNGPTQKLLSLVPLPNQSGDVSNYFNTGTQSMNRNNFDVKINWNRTDKHQFWVKYSVLNALVHGSPGLGQAGGDCLCDGGLGDGHTLTQLATIGQTYTVSPNFLIDATFGWTRFGQNVKPPDLGSNFGSDVLGIPGTNGPDPRESGMPAFFVDGYSALGNPESWNPLFRNDQSYTVNANITHVKGNHEFRYGFDLMHHHMNHWQPELGEGPRGAFSFYRAVTALNPEAIATSVGFQGDTPTFENDWNSLAGFLLGAPSHSGKSSQFIKMDSFENQWALYVRDRWRVTPRFTLNLGLRWELYPNRTRSAGLGIESYDPTTNEALIGGFGGIPRDNGVKYSKHLFAPRVGFAWQVGTNTVIRSGYGITYHSHPWGAQALRGWYPLTIVAVFDPINGYQPVTSNRSYVQAGVPNAPLGPSVGIPSICCPDISKGRVPLPDAAETGYVPANQELNRGYIQSWNFIVEHKLPGEIVTSVGYVGSKFVRGFGFLNINASQIPGSGDEGRPLYALFGRTAATREYDGRTFGNYHSLQVAINRRFTSGLMLKGAYTFSKSIDNAEYSDWTEFMWNAISQLGRNRAASDFNIPHNFQLAYVYELPFGGEKRWAKNGAARTILGGWQINGIFSAFNGRQYTLTSDATSLNMPGNTQTPDQIKPTVAKIGCVGPDENCYFFDTTAFAPVTDVRFGNVGRNTMRAPGVVNMDMSMFRTFKMTERIRMEFRAEAFNISNTPHFNAPDSDVTSSSFGKILSTDDGYGTSAGTRSREFRFGLRLDF